MLKDFRVCQRSKAVSKLIMSTSMNFVLIVFSYIEFEAVNLNSL